MKKIVRTCYLTITGKNKTPETIMTELGEAMANDLCLAMFSGKKLSYSEISIVSANFLKGVEKYLTDSIERHTLESEEALRYHGQQIKEAEKAIELIRAKSLKVA